MNLGNFQPFLNKGILRRPLKHFLNMDSKRRAQSFDRAVLFNDSAQAVHGESLIRLPEWVSPGNCEAGADDGFAENSILITS